ncbi:hypothetical protein [Pseudooceanicola sp. LIPI14-2-Ac024]|uniref:hypothetical protein n=1 Tax=Pseudooceanicola sp. LIPI14-2-Ac024 TaxID=3344875 RepID=UPI0035CF2D2F
MNPFFQTSMMMMTLPMQTATVFWANYYRAVNEMMSAALPPGACEASEAAAAGAAAVAKGTRTPRPSQPA